MRTSTLLVLSAVLALGCDNGTSGTDGGADQGVHMDGALGQDLAVPGGDGGAPTACNPNDPNDDGSDCSTSFTCPTGQSCVQVSGSTYQCFHACDPGKDTECACDRRCVTLTSGDAGVVGGACLKGNGAGERCGVDTSGMPFGHGACAQNLTCAGSSGGAAYCLYDCKGQTDCPFETTCAPITNQSGMTVGNACILDSTPGGIAAGMSCSPTSNACVTDYLCGGTTCDRLCDGPGGMCASGTCTALTDPNKNNEVVAYLCK